MKKFSEWVNIIREAEMSEASDLQKSYQDYFKKKLDKYGVKSPAELSEDEKKKFFSEISTEWEKGKGLKDGVTEGITIKINEKDVKNAADFKEYAETVLKQMHGDKYDQAEADKVIKGLSDEAEKSGDWGAAIGKLNKG